MARALSGKVAKRTRKKVFKLAKGYFGSKHRLYKTAKEQVFKSLAYSYRDRRDRKRDFRKLWITRINAATNLHGMSYSKFMYGLKLAKVDVNRKMLSELAINDPKSFDEILKMAVAAVKSQPLGPGKPKVVVAQKAPKKPVAPKVVAKPVKKVAQPTSEKPVKSVVAKVEKSAPAATPKVAKAPAAK
jgi:large subunit ribosomal protein L20